MVHSPSPPLVTHTLNPNKTINSILKASNSTVPEYSNKDVIATYLSELKHDNKLGSLQYCLFQPSVFMDYFAHPYPLSPGLDTWPFSIDFENRRAIIIGDGTQDMVLTAVSDVSEVLALALDDEAPWPEVGGMTGAKTSPRELLEIGKKVRKGEWEVEYLKYEDVERGVLKSSWVPRFDHPTVEEEQKEAFSRHFLVTFSKAMEGGKWVVDDALNKKYPDFKFVGLEEYLSKAWEGKP